ncbi:MAG: anhydro-N-acetylmuramic acid kinase, partial [Gammaproteobacteria bacterium]|nr:anhydro-N-acetylmuramic acid kinase [Gammaproteobacteria bacterium]
TTVADFRRRDIAAGGEGAPLAPAFHAAAFAAPHNNRAIVNIGGISNATLLRGMALEQGFDTGPGNTLLDNWVRRHRGQACDLDGRWAASATVHQGLLDTLLSHTYFDLTGPRSTGKEAFNLDWLDQVLRAHPQAEPGDIQATLAQFTVESIARGIASAGIDVDQVYVCGGGAHNADLMDRLRARLAPAKVDTTAALGMNPDWVEAAAFAWLAQRTLDGLAGNAPAVTGAAGERILGGVFAGSLSG